MSVTHLSMMQKIVWEKGENRHTSSLHYEHRYIGCKRFMKKKSHQRNIVHLQRLDALFRAERGIRPVSCELEWSPEAFRTARPDFAM